MENNQGELIDELKEMCITFQEYIGQHFRESDGLDSRLNLTDVLTGILPLTEQDVENCDGSITPDETMEAMADCSIGKAPGQDDLPYELYKCIPDLFEHLLGSMYANW